MKPKPTLLILFFLLITISSAHAQSITTETDILEDYAIAIVSQDRDAVRKVWQQIHNNNDVYEDMRANRPLLSRHFNLIRMALRIEQISQDMALGTQGMISTFSTTHEPSGRISRGNHDLPSRYNNQNQRTNSDRVRDRNNQSLVRQFPNKVSAREANRVTRSNSNSRRARRNSNGKLMRRGRR